MPSPGWRSEKESPCMGLDILLEFLRQKGVHVYVLYWAVVLDRNQALRSLKVWAHYCSSYVTGLSRPHTAIYLYILIPRLFSRTEGKYVCFCARLVHRIIFLKSSV